MNSSSSANYKLMIFDGSSKWTGEENKRFEDALALYDKETGGDRWENVARMIPGKTVMDVMNQYRKLEEDISEIEAAAAAGDYYMMGKVVYTHTHTHTHGGSVTRGTGGVYDHEKKKGIPWTQEEHRQFLLGLKKYGKGDWRNISRNMVTSRTPTQVASHAQKYFIRQLSAAAGGKDKRRSSIHDITTLHLQDTTLIKPQPHHNNNHNKTVISESHQYHHNDSDNDNDNARMNMLLVHGIGSSSYSYGPQNGGHFTFG